MCEFYTIGGEKLDYFRCIQPDRPLFHARQRSLYHLFGAVLINIFESRDVSHRTFEPLAIFIRFGQRMGGGFRKDIGWNVALFFGAYNQPGFEPEEVGQHRYTLGAEGRCHLTYDTTHQLDHELHGRYINYDERIDILLQDHIERLPVLVGGYGGCRIYRIHVAGLGRQE